MSVLRKYRESSAAVQNSPIYVGTSDSGLRQEILTLTFSLGGTVYSFSNKLAGLQPVRFDPISRIEPKDPPRRVQLTPAERHEADRRVRATLGQMTSPRRARRVRH